MSKPFDWCISELGGSWKRRQLEMLKCSRFLVKLSLLLVNLSLRTLLVKLPIWTLLVISEWTAFKIISLNIIGEMKPARDRQLKRSQGKNKQAGDKAEPQQSRSRTTAMTTTMLMVMILMVTVAMFSVSVKVATRIIGRADLGTATGSSSQREAKWS